MVRGCAQLLPWGDREFFGGFLELGLASCRFAIGTGEGELASIHFGLPPLSLFMPMNRDCGC